MASWPFSIMYPEWIEEGVAEEWKMEDGE